MLSAFDAVHQRLDLAFDSAAELAKYLANLESRGLFLVRLPSPLAVRQRILVRLTDGKNETSVESEVEQVFRSGAAEHGIALRPMTEIANPIPASQEAPQEESMTAPPPTEGRELQQGSEAFKTLSAIEIRRLNVTQRLRLATRAGRLERQILLRDTSPQVLMALLANPQIDEQEVKDLVRSPHAASGVLQHVAKDRRWSANHAIRLSLVKNPKTPTPLAQRLLPTLRKPDLQALAKSPNVREAIKGAALRLYLGKL